MRHVCIRCMPIAPQILPLHLTPRNWRWRQTAYLTLTVTLTPTTGLRITDLGPDDSHNATTATATFSWESSGMFRVRQNQTPPLLNPKLEPEHTRNLQPQLNTMIILRAFWLPPESVSIAAAPTPHPNAPGSAIALAPNLVVFTGMLQDVRQQ